MILLPDNPGMPHSEWEGRWCHNVCNRLGALGPRYHGMAGQPVPLSLPLQAATTLGISLTRKVDWKMLGPADDSTWQPNMRYQGVNYEQT